MYMRDLACCARGSLMTRRNNGIVVAVASNIAHAHTAALALKVADVFAEQK
jgi:CO dehydrogenase/acetyl-CoA synthase alpha subunit